MKAVYVTQEAKFESIMQTIKDVEINALRRIDPNDDKPERYMSYTYLMSEDLYKWTQHVTLSTPCSHSIPCD